MPESEAKRILVVDDDEAIQELATMTLKFKMESCAVESASNGLEALESVARSMPHLILLDMKMPVMDGWAFSREFHARHDHNVPIVIMTAAADARQRAQEVGASGWIGKPFDLDEFVEVIARHLNHL